MTKISQQGFALTGALEIAIDKKQGYF